jgi:hypothetical protein
MKFHETEVDEISRNFHGIAWNSMENFMEISWNFMKFMKFGFDRVLLSYFK